MTVYIIECPRCKAIFEVDEETVGKPPFDAECPKCERLVGSKHIVGQKRFP